MISKNKYLYLRSDNSIRVLFAIFGLINYPLFFLLTENAEVISVELILRIVSIFLCAGIFFAEKIQNITIKSLYWFATYTFCLPFFTVFMLLNSALGSIWILNIVLATFLLLIITDWKSFFLSVCIGVTIAIIFSTDKIKSLEYSTLKSAIYNSMWVILVSILFNVRRSVVEKETFLANQKLLLKLRNKNNQLTSALETKENFLRNISHEIRTPLHGILSLSQTARDEWNNIDDSAKSSLITKIALSSERFTEFIENVLDLSTISKGKFKINPGNYDLIKTIKETIAEFDVPDNKIPIEFHCEYNYIEAYFDEARISQVIRNLISNALRYGNNTNVIVSVSLIQNIVYASVQDHGVGIPQNETEQIFNSFTESSNTKSIAGGTGLGLAICKEIISQHNQNIKVTSDKKNGTIFTFTLSLTEKQIEKLNINKESESIIKKINNDIKILIIDDQQLVLDSTSFSLLSMGFKVVTSLGGVKGLKTAVLEKPDLILLDLMMPDIHGVEILTKIRKDKDLKHTKVIIHSGAISKDIEVKLHNLKIDGILIKPYRREDLYNMLKKVLSYRLDM